MKREIKVILAVVICAIVIAAGVYFAKLTGYAVVSGLPKVTRDVSFSDGEVHVRLNISSGKNIVAISDGDGGGAQAKIADPQLRVHGDVVVVGIPVIGSELVVGEAHQLRIALVIEQDANGGQDVTGRTGDM